MDDDGRRWLFTSDLHGQTALYEQLLALVAVRRPEAVIVGGDLGPHQLGEAGVRQQRVFLQGFLVEFARRLHEASAGTVLLLMMGNDDWAANADCLEVHHGALWQSIHGRAVNVGGVVVAGSSWVPITPFSIKDWERWDDGDPESPVRLDGVVSVGGAGALVPHAFDPAERRPTIADALADLAALAPAAATLLVSHSPPRDTRCDVVQSGAHVGSRALRRHIERHAPPLVLSGHIHESPRVTGAWRDTIGTTAVVNPGQFGSSRLCGAWFDPLRPDDTLRHTVHG
jgi:Icc-related predicted phosphoesterase